MNFVEHQKRTQHVVAVIATEIIRLLPKFCPLAFNGDRNSDRSVKIDYCRIQLFLISLKLLTPLGSFAISLINWKQFLHFHFKCRCLKNSCLFLSFHFKLYNYLFIAQTLQIIRNQIMKLYDLEVKTFLEAWVRGLNIRPISLSE